MEVLEIFNTVEFWFGLTTGALIADVAKNTVRDKFKGIVGSGSEEKQKQE